MVGLCDASRKIKSQKFSKAKYKAEPKKKKIAKMVTTKSTDQTTGNDS